MFIVSVETTFAASHIIPDYPGLCSRLHGHNWTVAVSWSSEGLDPLGMALDFHEAENLLAPVIGELDHSHLNDHPFFKDRPPTSEQVAFFIFGRLKEKMNSRNKPFSVRLDQVSVTEMAPFKAIYRETF
ncbi:MAG: 6-carboxytetrahydropterin synthase [Leptospirillum sp.]